MSNINTTTFIFNNQPIRVVSINGERWLVGSDICKAFDLAPQWGSARYRRYLQPTDSMLVTKKSHPDLLDYGANAKGRGLMLVNKAGMKRMKELRLRKMLKEATEFADSLIYNFDKTVLPA